ncbi:2OG-Fe(II) oxygenase [Psychroflexus maritimus]|uniref:2OG-Fe(II) oxygenase n=1 Tax=Psychroflexus maritimus TaxID=2714865 RepID=A0A967E0L0_9FLAO|nr:2OG-Fe(II) oxygenase [Psychroflexus maritimus]NGZ90757.1 2OG-Fe(II) oxygenase [Psychroflexus maritimus]
MKRKEIAQLIVSRIQKEEAKLTSDFTSDHRIPYFFVDDLLPEDLAHELHLLFPSPEKMMLKKSIRENKYVGFKMNTYPNLLEECIYAFQEKKVVELISKITGIEQPIPDEHLYAGGLSLMEKNQFLNPHLDNSHDKDRKLWRVLNLLYYVTPNWELENGGNLEIWPEGLKGKPITIVSKFNRLAIMATHQESLHSVSPVKTEASRKCISNYYFSEKAFRKDDEFHVTSFRGRPDEKIKDKILQADAKLRMGIRKLFKKGIIENPHVYKKGGK